jgi:phytoene dehydrogenase-like protein
MQTNQTTKEVLNSPVIPQKMVIIGAGLTGICLAIYLKKQGHFVKIIEKNGWPGGIFASTVKRNFIFNSGLEFYFNHNWILSFFDDIGVKVDDFLQLKKFHKKYKTYLKSPLIKSSIDVLELNDNLPYFGTIIKKIEGSVEGLENLIRDLDPLQEQFKNLFENGSDKYEFEKFVLSHDIRGSLEDYLKKYFVNPATIEFFGTFSLFFGSFAHMTPAYYVFLLVQMITQDGYILEDGFADLAEKLYFLALELGVEFWFDSNLESLNIENGKVKNLKFSNSKEQSEQLLLQSENKFDIPFLENILDVDILITTSDYESFEKTYIKDKKLRNYTDEYYENLEYKPSYTTFYLALKKDFPALTGHNFLSKETDNQNWISDSKKPSSIKIGAPLYFTVNSKTPDSNETLKILSFQPFDLKSTKEDQEKLLLKCLERISAATSINLPQYIDSYYISDLEDVAEQFLYTRRSPYGINHNLKEPSSYLLTTNSKISNLYYSTNSNYPSGNGLLSIVRAKSSFKEIVSALTKK